MRRLARARRPSRLPRAARRLRRAARSSPTRRSSFPAPQRHARRRRRGPADPIPIAFPRDDGPHDRLTEWWYYTGHLRADDGRRFGFEAVVFRAERGGVPAAWASHLALTDEDGQAVPLRPAERESGRRSTGRRADAAGDADRLRSPDRRPEPEPRRGGRAAPRRRRGGSPARTAGTHRGGASRPRRPRRRDARSASTWTCADQAAPALHDGDGFVDFGPAGSSYYYSRTRLAATGEMQLDGERLQRRGHRLVRPPMGRLRVGRRRGWDWFAINLDPVFDPSDRELAPERDITVSVVRDAAGEPILLYGTLVEPGLGPVRLGPDDFEVTSLGTWSSPIRAGPGRAAGA